MGLLRAPLPCGYLKKWCENSAIILPFLELRISNENTDRIPSEERQHLAAAYLECPFTAAFI